ncbi:hypothetical protein KIPE111705_30525 [Kibdelosporangium persicum]|uniref:Secreted repeat protein with Y-X4-D motif n=1 Tax=Kibdelosporangium persicum TaxID=2698649 RepID=A0ABX2F0Y6_9PSEU|nr:hypothetical protein [Kibdelosporangium persicum]NRN64986.1 Secreted repeat protein with Y-X4-D motif [Kibdelosporangium persicum]
MARSQSAVLAAVMAVGLTACTSEPEQQSTALAVEDKGAAASSASAPLLLYGTARQYNVSPDSTDWLQLRASRAGRLNSVVVDSAGMTLYRFDKDASQPSASTCDGDCAAAWPPLTVAPRGRIFLDRLAKSDIGVITRNDGTLQVTIGGWPVYRNAKDKQPGDTFGQAVSGTWFGVTPNGEKAGAAGPASPLSAEKVTLYDSPNLVEPAQDVTGDGCQNLDRPGVASSVSAPGWITLWSERDCKGKALQIKGNIPDLASARFDDRAASVSFG